MFYKTVTNTEFENSNVSVLQVKVCTCRGRLNRHSNDKYVKRRASYRWKYV
jgi:hypothetical protein